MTSLALGVEDPARTRELTQLVESLIERAAQLTPADLTPEVRRHVGLVFADAVGVIVAGAQSPEMRDLITAVCRTRGSGRDAGARILDGQPGRDDPATAAWLHGTAGSFLELDDGVRPTGHPGMHVVPAALAMAEETKAAGSDLLVAIAAGYEVTARMHQAFTLPGAMHPHGHFGAMGAATAAAMLRGSDAVAVAGVAATQPLLTGWAACMEGATARNTWTGHANRAGIQSETLHRAGFRGSFDSHLSIVGAFLDDAAALSDPIDGSALRITENYFKFHSVCALGQASLDAIIEARDRLGVDDAWSVDRIEIETVAANMRIAVPAAPNSLSTRFSLPYAVAATMLHGRADPSAMEWDASVARYAGRVLVSHDPGLDAAWPGQAPARVRLHQAGVSVEVTVNNPHGHHTKPASYDDLRAKFISILEPSGFDADQCSRAFDALAGLDDVADCNQLQLPEASVRTTSYSLEA